MTRLLLICILFCPMMVLHAQLNTDQHPSELISALQKNNSDSTRLQLLLQLARKYYFERGDNRESLDSVFIFLQTAQQLSVGIHPSMWQPEILCYFGKYYYKIGDTTQASDYDNKAIDLLTNLGTIKNQLRRWKRLAWNIAVLDSIGLTRINCFERMEALYKQLNDIEKEIEMEREIADTHMKQGKLDIAETELLDVLNKYKAIGFQNLHYTYNLLSRTNHLKGNYDKALRYALLAIESMEKTKDTGSISNFYAHLALLHHELGQTKKSIEYYKIYFEIDHRHNFFDFYYFREASFFVSDLIKEGQEEEAGRFLVQFSKKYPPGDLYSKAILAKTFADYYNAVQQYALADKYIQEMVALERSLGKNNEIKRDIEYDIGEYYFGKKQFGKAATYFEKALVEAILNNSASTIKDIHLMLFKTDSSLGNYVSAIKHLNQYRQLNDSIFTVAKIKEAEEVQVRYETEKKEQNIRLLERERELQQIKLSEASITRNWILGGTGLLLVIVVLLVYNTRLKQRTNKKLQLQGMEIEKQNVSLRHLVNEKGWLLKEIHHRVKNNLQIVMSLLNRQSAYIDNEPALTAIQNSQNRVHAMSLIHQKLYNSENLSSIDMSFYIRELTTYLRDSFNTGQRIHFEFCIEPLQMDVIQAVPLGLILNEAITNAIKYAFPDDRNGVISISLSASNSHQIVLSISDNGIGILSDSNFDHKESGSLGMSLMQGLAEDLDGDLSIENNNGTTIKVSFVKQHGPVRHNPLITSLVSHI